MAVDFDKEMDFLLRNAARQDDFLLNNPSGNHLDADTLAAFSENALPQAARINCVEHLADCNDCRQILAKLILLNEDAAEIENVTETIKTPAVEKVSWLAAVRKFFTVPTLGYATAALAILLVGSFAYVALLQSRQTQSTNVAQNEPMAAQDTLKPQSAPAPRRVEEEESVPAEIAEPSPSAENSNTATLAVEQSPTPDRSGENLPPSVAQTINRNANQTTVSGENTTTRSASETSVTTTTANTSVASSRPGATPPAAAGAPAPTVEAKTTADIARSSEAAKDSEEQTDDRAANTIAGSTAKRDARTASNAPKIVNQETPTRTIGGKNFRKRGGSWIDADYNGQSLANIARNSNEYKNLNAGLRSIADSLGGEVIIVWQGKAYRIR